MSSLELLTPSAEEAVDGVREAFLTAFRSAAGPGSEPLGLCAWAAWRGRLLSLDGIAAAENWARHAASMELNSRSRYAPLLWLSEGRLARAVGAASIAASNHQ